MGVEKSVEAPAPVSQWEFIRSTLMQYDKQAYALLLGAAYVIGFVALNAHLGKIGIYDFEFASTRIVLAFANCLFYLVCFYVFAGRAVLFGKKWMQAEIDRLKSANASPAWGVVAFFASHGKSVFFCCFSAAIFSSLAIDNASALLFYAAAAVAFLVFYPFDVMNWDLRHPRIFILAGAFFDIAATVAFFVQPNNEVAVRVFFSYLAVFVFINMILDQFERRIKTNDMISFVALYGSIFCITIAAGFGSMFYGLIPSRLGGGKAMPVELVLSDSFLKSLPADQAALLKSPLKANLVFQTGDSYYVDSGKKIFRLRTSDVPLIYFSPQSESNFSERLAQSLRARFNKP